MNEFQEKLRSIQFGVSTQTSKKNYYDKQSIEDNFGKDASEKALDETDGIGTLRWSSGRPYKKRRLDDTWEPASPKDTDRILGLAGSKEDSSRKSVSFGGK